MKNETCGEAMPLPFVAAYDDTVPDPEPAPVRPAAEAHAAPPAAEPDTEEQPEALPAAAEDNDTKRADTSQDDAAADEGGERHAEHADTAEGGSAASADAAEGSGAEQADESGTFPTEEEIRQAIYDVVDPEINISIIDLGLVYEILPHPEDRTITIRMTLTSPGCPLGPEMTSAVYLKVTRLPGVKDCQVDLVWTPAWDPSVNPTEETRMALGIW